MKKVAKIIVVTLLALMLALIVLPYAFRGKIMEAIKYEANKNLNARLDFEGVSISLLRSFPDLSVGVKNLSLSGVGDFERDTLVGVPYLRVTIDLMSVLRGEQYEIKALRLRNPAVKLKVLADGRVNWDIMKPDTVKVPEGEVEPSAPFRAALRIMEVSNGRLIYDDITFPMFLDAGGLEMLVKGDLSTGYSELAARASAAAIVVDYDGIRYLNKATASLESKIGADLNAWKFTFPDAKLRVNELDLLASGFFAMPDEGYDMDISFEAIRNDFKSFLSLVPAIYSKDFASLQAEGSLALKGFVKGLYSEETMPGFGVNIQIGEAMFRYPGLPEAVKNISVSADITNTVGDADATIIDVRRLHLETAGNPVDIRLYARTPVSDPYVDAKITGKLNLGDVGRFYPLEEGDELAGMLDADIMAKGNLSAIESKRYQDFEAGGRLIMSGVRYKTASLPQGLTVSEARLNLTPSLAELPVLKVEIGKNNLSASGRLENMLAYAFGKSDLKGSLNLSSKYFNVNDFASDSDDASSVSDTASIGIIEIPGGIDFVLTAAFDQVIYDNMDLKNVKGVMKIKDKVLSLENLNMNTLEGALGINGTYSTVVDGKPAVDFRLDIRDVDVRQAFQTFNTMEMLAPIAGLASGKISTLLSIKTDLDGNMMPVFSSVNGDGRLMSQALTISNVNSFNKLAETLKIDKFRQWVIEKVNLSFEMVDGKVFVKPFTTALGNTKAEISGWNSFDQTLEYVMQLNIPRSEFGGAANNILNNLMSEANRKGANFSIGEMIPVAVLIGGTISDPTITTSLKTAAGNAVDQMKQQITETIQQKKEEVVAKAREEAGKLVEEANLQAQKILSDAQKRADEVVRLADESAAKIRSEADKQAEQLIAEGRKKGPIAEMAAKKAAEKVKSEAAEKADKLVMEAQKQSGNIMAKARLESNKVVNDARIKAEGNQGP